MTLCLGQLGSWLTDGCRLNVEVSTSTVSVCMCNHLTNFAVLLVSQVTTFHASCPCWRSVLQASSCVNGTDCGRKIHLEVYIGCGVSLFFVCLLFIFMSLVRCDSTCLQLESQLCNCVTCLVQKTAYINIYENSEELCCYSDFHFSALLGWYLPDFTWWCLPSCCCRSSFWLVVSCPVACYWSHNLLRWADQDAGNHMEYEHYQTISSGLGWLQCSWSRHMLYDTSTLLVLFQVCLLQLWLYS